MKLNHDKSNEMLAFGEKGKPENKALKTEQRSKKLCPHMTSGQEMEPGPRWWNASSLTTVLTHSQYISIFKSSLVQHRFQAFSSMRQRRKSLDGEVAHQIPLDQSGLLTQLMELCLCFFFVYRRNPNRVLQQRDAELARYKQAREVSSR